MKFAISSEVVGRDRAGIGERRSALRMDLGKLKVDDE